MNQIKTALQGVTLDWIIVATLYGFLVAWNLWKTFLPKREDSPTIDIEEHEKQAYHD